MLEHAMSKKLKMPRKTGDRREMRMVLLVTKLSRRFGLAFAAVGVLALTALVFAAPASSSKVNIRDGMTYLWIPPGSYLTGCLPGDSECNGLERPREKVVVAGGFWISKTEVTQAAYMR